MSYRSLMYIVSLKRKSYDPDRKKKYKTGKLRNLFVRDVTAAEVLIMFYATRQLIFYVCHRLYQRKLENTIFHRNLPR